MAGNSLQEYIPSIADDELEEFVIINGMLSYIGNDELEKEIAASVGIETGLAGNTTMSDVVNITDKLFISVDDSTLPQNDTEPAPPTVVGKRLYDKNAVNMERWNMVIEYDTSNKEKARYGTGYYLLEPGTYTMNGEEVTITGRYILDYKKDTLIGISERAVEWSRHSTLAVKDGLVLNIDPTNLGEGEWTGITKYGDVRYNKQSKALEFNKNAEANPNGEGVYLELSRSDVDFANGFTYEIYANLNRLNYTNTTLSNNKGMGMFCRMPTLNSAFQDAMRFGYTQAGTLCKFHSVSSWNGTGSGGLSTSSGSVIASNLGYSKDTDFYMTVVYNRNSSLGTSDRDVVEYYVNGELLGYTYYTKDSYNLGLNTWNKDSCPFFIGVTPWHADGNLYYMQGSVYTCRLYTKAMNAEEVKENMDMTQKYRSSF